MADSDWPNPPVLTSKPTDGQTLVYQASSNTWIPATISSSGITVPGTHIAAAVAPAATTSSQNVTTAATDLPTSEALANALQVSYNAAQVDVAALRIKVNSLTTLINTLLTELQTAGVLAAS